MPASIPSRRSSGYTLIELLVVLVIVGILSIAVVAYRTDRNGPAVRGALNGIFGVLVDARALARGSGVAVNFTPSESGSKAVLLYKQVGVADGPSGQYSHASDSGVARFCIVDMDGSTTPGSAAIASLKDALEGTKVNTASASIFGATAWTQSIFDSSKTFTFNTNGTATSDAFVVVVGSAGGTALDDGPVGVILVNASGNIYRYYRTNASSAWVRL